MAQSFAGGWLSGRDVRPDARMRLFCLPHAGSGAAVFYRWKRELAPAIDVCPVLLPGREVRMLEPSLSDLRSLVDALDAAVRPYLDVSFAIFGHSMGALLAYEWALRVEAEGNAPRCLFVSGRNAPQVPVEHREIHRLDDAQFVEELRRRYGGMPLGFHEDAELRDVFMPILRADLRLVETYRHPDAGVLRCEVMAFAGVDDASVSDAGLAAWSERTNGGFAAKRIAGDHFFHAGAGQAELLRVIAARLE